MNQCGSLAVRKSRQRDDSKEGSGFETPKGCNSGFAGSASRSLVS